MLRIAPACRGSIAPSAAWVSRSSASDVEPDLLHLTVDVELGEATEGAEPGVVHEDVDRVVGVAEARFHRGDAVVGEEVGGQHLGVDAVRRGELGRERVEPGGVARDEHEVVAARGEADGEGAADARRRAGDERDAHAALVMRGPAPRRPSPRRRRPGRRPAPRRWRGWDPSARGR